MLHQYHSLKITLAQLKGVTLDAGYALHQITTIIGSSVDGLELLVAGDETVSLRSSQHGSDVPNTSHYIFVGGLSDVVDGWHHVLATESNRP